MDITNYFSTLAQRLRPNAIRQLSYLINRPGVISLAAGAPSADTFPHKEIGEIATALIHERGAQVLQYGVTRGNAILIEQVCEYMATRKVKAESSTTILTSGSQQGLDLVSRVLVEAGDVVFVERPSYIGGICALHNAGAELVSIPLAEDGLDLVTLAEQIQTLRLQGKRVKALYTIPNFQNPSGITLSATKRQALLEMATDYNFLIFEDDPYGELSFSDSPAPLPIKSLDTEGRVIYLGSFSKVLAPGLRTAWVVALPALTARIELAKEALDLCSSMLDQAIVSECYRQGLLQTRLPELRTFYRTRCQAMLSALDQHAPKDSHWTKPTGGLFVWLELPITCDSTQLLTRAVEEGVVFVPGAPFFVDNIKQNTMRMAFSKETPERISTAITKLCALI